MPMGWKGPSYPRAPVSLRPLPSFLCVCVWRLRDGCERPHTPPLRNGGLSPLFLDPCWPVTASAGRMPSKWRRARSGPRLERSDSFCLQPLRSLGLKSPGHCVRSPGALLETHGEALRWHGEEEGSSCPHQSIWHVTEAVRTLQSSLEPGWIPLGDSSGRHMEEKNFLAGNSWCQKLWDIITMVVVLSCSVSGLTRAVSFQRYSTSHRL